MPHWLCGGCRQWRQPPRTFQSHQKSHQKAQFHVKGESQTDAPQVGSEEAELRIWAANSLHTAANRINGELTAGEEFDCKLIRRNFSEVLVIFLFDMDFFFFFPQRRRDEKNL